LLVGKKTGEIAYYRNTGTAGVAEFTLINDTLGGIDVSPNTPDGYAVPHFFRVNDTTHLFLGAYDGKLHYYNDIDGNLDEPAVFQLVSDHYRNIDVGLYSSFWVEDNDADGLLNLYVGQDLGGLHHFEAVPGSTIGIEEETQPEHDWILVPNPAATSVTLQSLKKNGEPAVVTIYNLIGERVAQQIVIGTSALEADNFSNGVYLVVIESGNTTETLRLVIEK
jgi:hypothetical protein